MDGLEQQTFGVECGGADKQLDPGGREEATSASAKVPSVRIEVLHQEDTKGANTLFCVSLGSWSNTLRILYLLVRTSVRRAWR